MVLVSGLDPWPVVPMEASSARTLSKRTKSRNYSVLAVDSTVDAAVRAWNVNRLLRVLALVIRQTMRKLSISLSLPRCSLLPPLVPTY